MADYTSFTDQGLPPMFQALQAGRMMDVNNQARRAALEQALIQNRQSNANLERYQGQTPGLVAQSNLEGALATTQNNPDTLAALMAGKVGEAQTASAKGQVAQATVPSTIASTNATNETNISDKKIKAYENFLDFTDAQIPSLEAASKESPLNADMKYQEFLGKLDPKLRQLLPKTYGPDVSKHLDQLTNRAKSNLSHLRKLSEIKAEGDEKARVARINEEARVKAEKLKQAKYIKSAEQLMNEAKTDEQRVSVAKSILANPEITDPALRSRVQASYEQSIKNLAAKYSKGQVSIPGVSDPGQLMDLLNQRLSGTVMAPQQRKVYNPATGKIEIK